MDTIARREFLGTCVSYPAFFNTTGQFIIREEGDSQWLISTFQFSEPSYFVSLIRLVSMTLIVVPAMGAERRNIFEGQVSGVSKYSLEREKGIEKTFKETI